jgi:hypothetical protein
MANPPNTSDDELDAILNDLAGNTNTSSAQTQAEPQRSTVSNNADTGLGIDEEIVITKYTGAKARRPETALRCGHSTITTNLKGPSTL